MRRPLPRKTDPSVDLELVDLDGEPEAPPSSFEESGETVRPHVVAIECKRADVAETLRSAFSRLRIIVGGTESVSCADVVFVDHPDRIASVRARARSHTAIIVLLDRGASDGAATAQAAGAFACVRLPIVPSEVVVLTSSALGATDARARVADLTAQLDLQAHLASIGRMSAGLTHELGNPLFIAKMSLEHVRDVSTRLVEAGRVFAAILEDPANRIDPRARAAASAQLEELGDPSDIFEVLGDAEHSYARMEGVLGQLRALVQQGAPTLEAVPLLELVHEVKRWAGPTFDGVEVEIEGSPIAASAEKTMLGQILLNFATNAALSAKALSAPRVRFHIYGSKGQAVVSVRDNGPGIPADMQDKIFEPFFTTRRGKGGTGLGLALCREYARRMGAELSLWSAPGRGACFRVHLKRAMT